MLFQSVIDTSDYMLAGYAIFFVVGILYLFSLVARRKKLLRDLDTLQDMNE